MNAIQPHEVCANCGWLREHHPRLWCPEVSGIGTRWVALAPEPLGASPSAPAAALRDSLSGMAVRNRNRP